MSNEAFKEWKKERYPDGCIIKVLYGKGANIESPLEEAFNAGYKAKEADDDAVAIENVFNKMPTTVYIAMQELCLATPWDLVTRRGLKLTSAGKHLAEYCTC